MLVVAGDRGAHDGHHAQRFEMRRSLWTHRCAEDLDEEEEVIVLGTMAQENGLGLVGLRGEVVGLESP